jgi:hypothetical protein
MIIFKALGIGRPGEVNQRAAHNKHLFRSVWLSPWNNRFRFGWVMTWDGLYWHNAIGVKADDFNNGDWLGGGSWQRGFGPIAMCRYRRRGSLRCDITFERNMGCCCQHVIWSWLRNHGQVKHNVLCPRVKDAS